MQDETKYTDELISSLYAEHYQDLLRLARRLGYNRDLAEDLVQETFEIVLRSPEKLIASDSKKAWLFGILRKRIDYVNRSAEYAEKLQRRLEHSYVGASTDELKLTTLYGGSIDKEDLELLIGFYVEGRNHKELAEKYGFSPANCRKHIQRAKERLRRLLEESALAEEI